MSLEENKQVSRIYHDLKVEDIDKILTPGFVGHHPDGSTWDMASHKRFWTANRALTDTIQQQIAEGDWVATRFTRAGTYQGKQAALDMMHFKRFEGGIIAELWELYDSKQVAT